MIAVGLAGGLCREQGVRLTVQGGAQMGLCAVPCTCPLNTTLPSYGTVVLSPDRADAK